MKYILPKTDLCYFDESVNSLIESHSKAQLRVEIYKAIVAEREACAQVAAGYGPSRPIVSKNPSPQIVGRWEGEQAASSGIEAAIRAREQA